MRGSWGLPAAASLSATIKRNLRPNNVRRCDITTRFPEPTALLPCNYLHFRETGAAGDKVRTGRRYRAGGAPKGTLYTVFCNYRRCEFAKFRVHLVKCVTNLTSAEPLCCTLNMCFSACTRLRLCCHRALYLPVVNG